MKANQKFANADDAVSPVIGVILMVAITVVLAAVVFVLVSDLGGDSSVASFPNVAVKESGTPQTIQMEHLGGECITIEDYRFNIGSSSDVAPNTAADGTGTTPTSYCVGDKIYLASGVSDGTAVEIVVIDEDAQAQVYKKTIQL